jgi:hypothetical protein
MSRQILTKLPTLQFQENPFTVSYVRRFTAALQAIRRMQKRLNDTTGVRAGSQNLHFITNPTKTDMEEGQSEDGLSMNKLVPKVLADCRRRRHGLSLRVRSTPFPSTPAPLPTPQMASCEYCYLAHTVRCLSVWVHHDSWLSCAVICTVHGAIISVTNRRSLSTVLFISSSYDHATFLSNLISAVSIHRHTPDPGSVRTRDNVICSRIFSVRQINPFRAWLTQLEHCWRCQHWRQCQHCQHAPNNVRLNGSKYSPQACFSHRLIDYSSSVLVHEKFHNYCWFQECSQSVRVGRVSEKWV